MARKLKNNTSKNILPSIALSQGLGGGIPKRGTTVPVDSLWWSCCCTRVLYRQKKQNNRNCPEAISGRVKHPRPPTRHTPALEHLARVLQQTDCIGILSGSHQYLVALCEYKNRCVALCACVCVLAHVLGKKNPISMAEFSTVSA